MNAIRSGAAALAATVHGAGTPTAVLLHAGVADRRAYAAPAEHLDRTVLAYDRRGFGQTTYEAEPFDHGTDLLAVLDSIGRAPVWLVGNSQGGRIAIDFTVDHPDRVAGLVLIAPALSEGPDAPEPELDAPTQALDDAIMAADDAGDMDHLNCLEARLWLDGPAQPEGRVTGPARELFLDMNGIALNAPDPGDTPEPPDVRPRLPEIAVPTLVLCGDLDVPFLIDRSRRIAGTVPGARLQLLDGVAHLPQLERPAEVAGHINAFWA